MDILDLHSFVFIHDFVDFDLENLLEPSNKKIDSN